jgi:hypothetical protein
VKNFKKEPAALTEIVIDLSASAAHVDMNSDFHLEDTEDVDSI